MLTRNRISTPALLMSAALLAGGATGAEDADERGRQLVAAAVAAMGGDVWDARRARDADPLVGLSVRAACTGPRGTFVTEVESWLPDRALMRQTSERGSAELVVVGDVGWRVDPRTGEPIRLAAAQLEMVRGHEFHRTLLELDERFRRPRFRGREVAEGRPCLAVDLEDANGLPAAACFDEETGLPWTISFQPGSNAGDEPIRMRLESWGEGEIRFLESFTLRHGEDVFTYRYESIRINDIRREAFAIPPGLAPAG